MSLLDRLLHKQLQAEFPAHTQRGDLSRNSQTNTLDWFETPAPYKSWVPGLSSLLRLHYLKVKRSVLIENKQSLRYDVSTAEIHRQIASRLDAKPGVWHIVLRSVILLPLLLLVLAVGAYALWQNHQASLERAVFKNDIPGYSDAVYRLKASKAAAGKQTNTDVLNQINQNIDQQSNEVESLKNRIVGHFIELPDVSARLTALLDAIQKKDLPPQELYQLVKQVNDELFVNDVPFYLSPMVEAADCAHLPSESFLTRLFGGGGKGSGDTCVIYALLTYHVEEYRNYNSDDVDHLAYFTRRLDDLELYTNILGKVHLGDDSAQILLSNIDASSASSTVALNDGRLQAKLMPQGMPDVYGLESIARRLQARVVEQYADEITQSWRWKLDTVWGRLTGSQASVLPKATARLQQRIADATAFHEVQHLIDQSNDLMEPVWFSESLEQLTINIPVTDQFRRGVLWELSAFFTHLAYGDELTGILLNEFAAITLNPRLQDQPHYYSIRMLLPMLHEMHLGTLGDTPPPPSLTLSDVARSYKYLAQNIDDIGQVSADAYQKLFGTELAEIDLTDIKRRPLPPPLN
jgi:hypothetical protein